MNKRIQLKIVILGISILTAGIGCDKNSSNKSETGTVKQVSIPLAGNAYLTRGSQAGGITKNGIAKWNAASNVYSVFFRLNKSADVKVAMRGQVSAGQSTVQLSKGDFSRKRTLKNTSFKEIAFGDFQLDKGYNQLIVKRLSTAGNNFTDITDLVLKVPQKLSVTYVKDNKSNHFYWGRRGPSVHLAYKLPNGVDAEWLYSEIKVPDGKDPVGSYFMANGFGEGYFGIQVNSGEERHILFSVWSPYKTDNPDEIPESQRIKLLKKGKGVHAGKFGNEGSGGQSYWSYNWKANVTYKFLTRVTPDHKGNTTYTAYFYAPERGKWKLIASFSRPKTDKYLTGAHSFLENFKDSNGYKTRKAYYGNQWIKDKNGEWHEITEATFTGDNIANIGYRLDFRGGAEMEKFYLQNGGFFDSNIPLNSHLNRTPAGDHPKIEFNKLP